MANTTNFGWETPDDTDLVKDGAAAMRTLGNAIDTSMGDLKGGTTGQILKKTSNTDMDFEWTNNDVGDITAVTAGTGLSGGGTSGDVTLTNTVATAYDAKGDLVVGTGADTFAKLSAGADGYTLVADSAQTTGLNYAPTFFAGKNKIINGDFFINQRAFTSNTTALSYNFDRWYQSNGGTSGTLTVTPQTFTAGTAPVAGYEARNYVQCVTAAGANADTYALYNQKIEDVRTLAGNTATISFWAKAGSGTPKIAVELEQSFGTGGSPSSTVYTAGGTVTLSTSWTRYSVTISVPSLTGKTVGTTANTSYLGCNLWLSAGTDFATRASSIGLQNATFQIWGVQLEAGSTATAFQTATGTIQGELAACQRYYNRVTANQTYSRFPAMGSASGTRYADNIVYIFPVRMRVMPTSLDYSTLAVFDGNTTIAVTSAALGNGSTDTINLNLDCTSGLTTYRPYEVIANNSTSAYIGFNAEL